MDLNGLGDVVVVICFLLSVLFLVTFDYLDTLLLIAYKWFSVGFFCYKPETEVPLTDPLDIMLLFALFYYMEVYLIILLFYVVIFCLIDTGENTSVLDVCLLFTALM